MPPVKKPKNKPNVKAITETDETTPVISGQLKKKLQSLEKRQKPKRGVVFIKHLPNGFFEDQIRRYFEQFGDVTRLRLARSKLTGGSKGFAFVEFDVPEVAEVAAETMDNYLMFNKVVKATYIPPEKQAYNFFKSSVRKVKNKAGKPIYVSYKTADINRRVKKFNEWTDEAYQKRTSVKQRRIKKLSQKYAHLGIDFNSIITGSKASNESERSTKGEVKSANKTGKRKATDMEKIKPLEPQTSKKTTKLLQLQDLLGTTLDDNESDDHDEKTAPKSKKQHNEPVDVGVLLGDTLNDTDDSEYEFTAEDVEEKVSSDEELAEEEEDEIVDDDESEESSESDESDDDEKTAPKSKMQHNEPVDVGVLLGDTLNDTDDSEYEFTAEDVEEKVSSDEELAEEEEDEIVDDDESEESSSEEELKKKKQKPANKKNKKMNEPKVDHLDKLIKHKKLTGGIQKPNKALPKKAKFDKPKNSMQAVLTKELAQLIPSLKKSSCKQHGKKQKK